MSYLSRLLGSNGQYSRYPLSCFTAAMEELSLHRLDFVPQPPHYWCDHTGYDSSARLKDILGRAGLQTEVLTPPPYRYSITASDSWQHDATLDYYTNCCRLAVELRAKYVVLGASGACWDVNRKILWGNARSALKNLSDIAVALGIILLLCPVMGENTPLMAESPVLGTLREIAAMLEEVGSPALRAALDTNVMSAAGETIPGWFHVLDGDIRLVRLADGNYHGYRIWGEGVLPKSRYLTQLEETGYEGFVSLYLPGERYIEDPKGADKQNLSALRDYMGR